MENKVIILVFLFVSFIGNSQNISNDNLDKLVSNFIKKLVEKKIDTVCIYESYCVGCDITFDFSNLNDKEKQELCRDELINQPVFVFWKEKGKTFITKINNCYEYSEIEGFEDDFWVIYFENINIIEKEKIKNFQYKFYRNGKKTYSSIFRDHSDYQSFKFILNNKIVAKYFDNFKLENATDNFDKKRYNMNYTHNNSLISKKIIDILEKNIRSIKESQYLIIRKR
ncbi:hypothetical protein ACNQGP_02490 [Flavobacterium sp. GT2N3]|uniref:hypothetical protein n=1 Tax=unclassified Flavobacterium TaxID=196869 RepID=UPI003AAFF928